MLVEDSKKNFWNKNNSGSFKSDFRQVNEAFVIHIIKHKILKLPFDFTSPSLLTIGPDGLKNIDNQFHRTRHLSAKDSTSLLLTKLSY